MEQRAAASGTDAQTGGDPSKRFHPGCPANLSSRSRDFQDFLGTSLKTTNALESIHARVESRTAKVPWCVAPGSGSH